MKDNIKSKELALLFGTFIIAICGLVYELLAGTLSSYLLGDSIYHFSLVIGLFMSSMGVGAWLSRFIEEGLERAFVLIQFSIALLGGFSTFILFYAFAYLDNYDAFLYLVTILLGSMLGVEIPLVIRILKESFSLKTNISNVFTVDYIGALFASLLFPLVLVPQLGLMQTSFLFGLLNLFVGALAWYIFRAKLGYSYILGLILILSTLLSGFFYANTLTSFIENKLYQHNIIYSKQTPYQNLTLTSIKGRVQFYINGAIQFDSIDEYRYHEALVHPAMQSSPKHEEILIIGGGDGMALREVLKYPNTKHITLVDLDPTITTLFKEHSTLRTLNDNAYESSKVKVVNQDAWKFLESTQSLYDVVIIDLPDPNNISLSRLYSKIFYTLLSSHLSKTAVIVTQASSPMFTHKAYWCIENTLHESGFSTLPYHTYIPSFGEWGFVMASKHSPLQHTSYYTLPSLKYFNHTIMQTMKIFPPDMAKISVQRNTLSKHPLIKYYNDGWEKWYAQ